MQYGVYADYKTNRENVLFENNLVIFSSVVHSLIHSPCECIIIE